MRLKSLVLAMALAGLAFAAQADDRSWQDYLKQADRNGDGHLDRFEIMLVPPRQAIGLKAMLAPRFKDIDRDGDGRLSIAEIDAERLARGQSDTEFRELLMHYPTAVRNSAIDAGG